MQVYMSFESTIDFANQSSIVWSFSTKSSYKQLIELSNWIVLPKLTWIPS